MATRPTILVFDSGLGGLTVLREIVKARPDGARRLYSLRPEPFQELDAWVGRYRRLWEGRLDRFAAELGRRQMNRKRRPQ